MLPQGMGARRGYALRAAGVVVSALAAAGLVGCGGSSKASSRTHCVTVAYRGQKVGLDLPVSLKRVDEPAAQSSRPTVVNHLATFEDADDSSRTKAVAVYAADPSAIDEEAAVQIAVNRSMPRFGEVSHDTVPVTPTSVGSEPAEEGTVSGNDTTSHAVTYLAGPVRFGILLWTRGHADLETDLIHPGGC
jgi:hypothetical protein